MEKFLSLGWLANKMQDRRLSKCNQRNVLLKSNYLFKVANKGCRMELVGHLNELIERKKRDAKFFFCLKYLKGLGTRQKVV